MRDRIRAEIETKPEWQTRDKKRTRKTWGNLKNFWERKTPCSEDQELYKKVENGLQRPQKI